MTEEELLEVIEQAAAEGWTELDLSGNKLTTLPPEIGKLTQLKKLVLGKYDEKHGYIGNNLSELPKEIGLLVQLEELQIVENQLRNLPAEIVRLTNLQSLDLENNQLRNLPREIVQLTNLQSLELSGNQLIELPEIVQLTNLQSLYLSSNQLIKLPVEIVLLTNLQSLYLSFNKLRNLPVEIRQLTNLQTLYLRENELRNLPAEIVELTNLQSLKLSGNKLSNLPAEIGQLTKLQILDLSSNQLNSLPAEFVKLTNLQSLHLSSNQLSTLPAEFGQLTNLQSLHLSSNQLSTLPAEFGQLTNLQSLHLSSNQLSTLPAEFGQLTNLQSLNLSRNQLSTLPETIKKLTKLEKLDLRGNPVPIPPEILGPKNLVEDPGNVKEILDFYFRIQDPSETEPLYEAKLLIVGEGEAGKTSLAKKIENENYKLKSDEKSTEGIDVIQWKFPLLNGKEFRVNIWDFGGQEIYHETHQFFLSKRSLYVLVADNRRENPNFYWWLKIVELLSENSPVVIIKNEKQNRKCEVNEGQLRGEFSNLKEFLATNLADNRGLDKIKEKFQTYISNLDHVGDKSPLPKIWVRVRSALENYSRNYIELYEYYQLCQINNLTDRQDMLRLSGFLHDLGVCLHFQDDSTLKHYVILKPEWATNAVYKVLDNEAVIKNLGRFTKEKLADIWQDSEYKDMQDELLQLMMRFKLCYPIPNRLSDYIAPQLLDNENLPDYTWDKSNNLILRYKYDFMPKGIITRFIVETHPFIEEQKLVWKSGAVLKKNETRAEIIENHNQKEIKVRVSGNRKKELLAVVTHELEKIHNSYERLKYQTLVPCNCEECRGSEKPYTYHLENLRRRLEKGRYEIECENSFEKVDVRRLIDDVNLSQIENNKNNILQQELEIERNESFHQNQTTMNNQDFQITGDQGKKLRQGLLSAYPSRDKLKMMIFYELGYNLDRIVGDSNLEEVVFNLIITAKSEGWLKDLICAASNSNPGNSDLKVIANEFLSKSPEKSPENSPVSPIKYQDFQILVDRNNNIRASSEQGDEPGKLRLEINKIKLTLKLIDSKQTDSELLKALGQELYQALFPNDINGLFKATVAAAKEHNHSVRLRLIFESPELASLPWEFLHYERTNTFLGNDTQTVLSRYIDVPLKKREIKAAEKPLKVLLVISSPTDLATLDATGEENLIREALKKHIDTGKIELDVLESATTSNIRQKLREKPYNVFHFIGHGDFQNEKGYIYLVDEYDKAKSLDDENFANFFLGNNNNRLGLIILNCCRGATVSSNQAFAGTVSNLVRRGIPAVVAMQYKISDPTAKLFADEFYRTLALGYPVDTAIQETRNAISQDVGLDKRDFGTPVLYMRAKDGIILSGL
ncbi:MAG: COR domain-containing protein [Cyanobacteria bacterium P01_A01_bin.84]